MIDWERSTDNKKYRELTALHTDGYISLVFAKETQKLEVSTMDTEFNDTPKVRKTPRIPIKDLIWLMNGDE